ncbi:BINDING PROTEIN putative-RELATED [Salix purpurea]|uniref:BINDING PROTEIN putative-RELATED n=1 Tax=Salix purpurea TaxID=77065 RepID=A0A9Q0VS76_SALPP|nr:BINDING PROTEIN putative-RELATED [Salix purpurea]
MGCFFSGSWFKSIIRPRKAKKDRSKKVKVHSATEKANGSKESSPAHGDPSNLANSDLESNQAVPGILPAEYIAAFRIQKAFRAYKARKTTHRLKGAVRFNVLIHGHDSQKQASSTLAHIHSWSNIQAQIRARRHHMVTEGRIKQKKLENQLKLEARLQEIEVEWCGGSDTMEEILSRIQQREEAAVKRERAMAYAFSHQWRANPTQYLGQAYYSLGKENWGWSWKERWVAARPWEIRVHAEPHNPKKAHPKQESKPEIKMTLPTKPALSNGKVSAKPKKLPSPAADYQDASSTAGSSHLLIPS